jgi:hypothetical protein
MEPWKKENRRRKKPKSRALGEAAVLAFWKFLGAKSPDLPPDASLFLSPSHAHPQLLAV